MRAAAAGPQAAGVRRARPPHIAPHAPPKPRGAGAACVGRPPPHLPHMGLRIRADSGGPERLSHPAGRGDSLDCDTVRKMVTLTRRFSNWLVDLRPARQSLEELRAPTGGREFGGPDLAQKSPSLDRGEHLVTARDGME